MHAAGCSLLLLFSLGQALPVSVSVFCVVRAWTQQDGDAFPVVLEGAEVSSGDLE